VRRSALFGAEVFAWWAACTGVWLVTLSSVAATQLYTAVAASLPCSLAAAGARKLARNNWSARPVWLRAFALLPVAIVTDTVQIFCSVLPGKRAPGAQTTVRIQGTEGEQPGPNWRRALATWLVCASPATFVIDFGPDQGEARIHSLPARGPSVIGAIGTPGDH